jgi:ferric-dicitrate binding protein FerR (iron transport regulator)
MDQDKLNLPMIEKFYRGKASRDEERSIAAWIENSSNNKHKFSSLEPEIKDRLINHPDQETIEKWDQIKARIAPNHNSIANTKKRPLLRTLAINAARYAAVLIVGALLASLYYLNEVAKIEKTYETHTQTISTPKGSRISFTLPDGSTVWLNAGSSITFPLNAKRSRTVDLNGEAYFEVVKNDKPFVVATQYGYINVKGTSFNVKAYENDEFLTTVESGLVTVESASRNNELTLKAGEQASIDKSRNMIVSRVVNTQIFTSWRNGVLIFHKDPLQTIVKKLERWYNVDIEVTPRTKLRNYRFTGTIEMESLTEVLELIRVTAPIKYTYDAKNRTVIIDTKENNMKGIR